MQIASDPNGDAWGLGYQIAAQAMAGDRVAAMIPAIRYSGSSDDAGPRLREQIRKAIAPGQSRRLGERAGKDPEVDGLDVHVLRGSERSRTEMYGLACAARRIAEKGSARVLLVDTLCFESPVGGAPLLGRAEREMAGAFLKDLASELKATIIACGGIGKYPGQRTRFAGTADLRHVGLPVEYCSAVALVYRSYYTTLEVHSYDARIDVRKSGGYGKPAERVWLPCDPSTGRVCEIGELVARRKISVSRLS
jgi:hypothetical protein